MSGNSDHQRISAPTCEYLEPRLLLSTGLVGPTLLSVSPPPNTHAAPRGAKITAEYDHALDEATVTDATFVVHAMQTGKLTVPPNALGVLSTDTVSFKPAGDYHAGELVQVSATTGIEDLLGAPPASPYVWQFRRAVADGSGVFRSTIQSLGNGRSNDVAIGDVDGDGDLDAFVANGFGEANKVWLNDGGGVFTDSGQSLGTGESHAVALGDLDGDGDLDAFVGNYAQGNRAWFNDGTGVFTDSGQGLGSGHTEAVELGDLDGDGDLDAYAVNWDQFDRIWQNDGQGTFSAGQSLNNLSNWDVALGDVDGDGDLDAFVAHGFVNGNTVWVNNGSGALSNSGQVLGNSYSYAAELGDVDGDGDLDAFVANGMAGGQGNRVWRNDGSGTFSDTGQSLGTYETVAVSLGDVDGDGDLDAFTGNRVGQGNRVWANDGAGVFTITAQTPGVANTHDVELGDLDGDGDLDAFAANFGAPGEPNSVFLNLDTVSVVSVAPGPNSHDVDPGANVTVTYDHDVYPNTVSDETFAVHAMQTGQLTAPPAGLSVSGPTVTLDPDQPFHPGELVQATATPGILSRHGLGAGLGTERGYVWQFRAGVSGGSGIYQDSGQSLGSAMTAGVALGDLDGDGDLDAFAANGGGNKVWRNNGAGTFTDSGQSLGTGTSWCVALGDLDGDGDLDAYVANLGESDGVWLNQGSGVFSGSGQDFGIRNSTSVSLGDLDGDGDLDAFVTNSSGQANTVWLNDGTGQFGRTAQNLGSSESQSVSLGDVDGDGDLDAFVANRAQADKVWLNRGTGLFDDSGQSLGASFSTCVELGDLDGDGDLDAFVANGSDEPDKVWRNGGTGQFADSGQLLGSSSSSAVALGDVDDDGDLDAFVTDGSGSNSVWVNDSAGNFADAGQSLGSFLSLAVALGDVDGDGDLDAFVANFTEANKVWRNLEPDGPRVADVAVSSRDWSDRFIEYLGREGLGKGGYSIPDGSDQQLRPLPWVNVNLIRILFDRNVSIRMEDLSVRGVTVSDYRFASFSYDDSSHIATWALEEPLGADRLLLVLDDAVTDEAGHALDGEWNNAISTYPSGNGEAGGDFRFEMNVLPGDVDGSKEVRSSDVIKIRRRSNTEPGDEGYSHFYDVDGSAEIRSSDTIKVRRKTNTSLPEDEPAAPGLPDVGAPIPTGEGGQGVLPLGLRFGRRKARPDRPDRRRSEGPVVLEIADVLSAPMRVALIEPAL